MNNPSVAVLLIFSFEQPVVVLLTFSFEQPPIEQPPCCRTALNNHPVAVLLTFLFEQPHPAHRAQAAAHLPCTSDDPFFAPTHTALFYQPENQTAAPEAASAAATACSFPKSQPLSHPPSLLAPPPPPSSPLTPLHFQAQRVAFDRRDPQRQGAGAGMHGTCDVRMCVCMCACSCVQCSGLPCHCVCGGGGGEGAGG